MGSFKTSGQRVVMFFMALLFLGSTVGLTIAILLEQRKKDDTTSLENQIINNTQEVQLEGTKLADFTPLTKVDDLKVIDLEAGTGAEVKPGDTVTAHYTGALVKDGTIFQSSHDFGEPATFGLDQVIKGWSDGVPGMKVGGKRRLIIPAALAYGEQSPSPNIPANSDLVFDIELVAVQ